MENEQIPRKLKNNFMHKDVEFSVELPVGTYVLYVRTNFKPLSITRYTSSAPRMPKVLRALARLASTPSAQSGE